MRFLTRFTICRTLKALSVSISLLMFTMKSFPQKEKKAISVWNLARVVMSWFSLIRIARCTSGFPANEKFSLVYMIATKVVYIKNVKAKTYAPFLSSNGKYCRYDESVGKILEI